MKAQKLNGKRNSQLWIKIFLTTLTLLLISCQSIPVVFAATPTALGSPQDDLPPTQDPASLAPTVTRQIFLPTVSNGSAIKRYFFDSVNGSDSNSGTSPSSPWKTLAKLNNTNFNPGEQVFLKRGSFWSGEWVIDNSGTASKPIIFSSYGDTGDLPTFSNTGTGLVSSIRIKSDYVVLEQVKTIDARLAGVYLITGADHNVVQYIEATNTGEGVKVNGQYNLITRNYIHDLKMVVNTPTGDDDYGATGIWLFNSYNEVSYNQIINCRAPSYDYGEDGGGVEFYLDVNGSYIHHNYVYNAKGFMEIGGGSAYDNVVAYNVIVDSGRALGLHLGGGFQSDIKRLYFYNNTVVDTTVEGFSATILFLGGTPTTDMLYLRNNVFYLKNYGKVAYNVVAGTDFTHTNNIYYLEKLNSRLGFNPTPSEIQANPNFVDVMGGNFTLLSISPAINNGVDLGYTIDFNGLPVPVGGSPDMGSHEFQTVQ